MVNLIVMFVAGIATDLGNVLSNRSGDAGLFAVDQRGKYVVYQTEPLAEGIDFSEVHRRLGAWMDAKGNSTSVKGPHRIESTGAVAMKKHAGIGNFVAGEIHYTLVVENNNGEVNYWFTDLAYQPYRNDRYSKRIKATTSPIPLEKQLSKLNANVWKKQKGYAYETINELAEQLAVQLEAAGKPKVITTSM